VVVIDRALATGTGGFLAGDVRLALEGAVPCADVIAGLGGRPVTRDALRHCLLEAWNDQLGTESFLDLRQDLLEEMRS
jgi:pyruvate ferredoxin oxidoreductase alpha subunit